MTNFHKYMTSQKLFLRPLTERDIPELYERISATIETLHPWMDWAIVPYHIDYTRHRVSMHMMHWAHAMGSRAYGIFSLETGGLIGEISVHHINYDDMTAQLGYWICSDYQKKAMMREAVVLVTKYLLEALEMNLVYIHCEAGNDRSLQLPRALGFHANIVLKDATINLLSKQHNDVHVFSRSTVEGLPEFACLWSDQPLRAF